MTTTQTIDYQSAKEIARLYETGIEKDIIGFVFTREVTSKSEQIQIAQHNYIIQYLVQINDRLETIRDIILKIELNISELSHKALDPSLQQLINKVENLSITTKPPRKDNNPFVFSIMKDPIVQIEKGKEIK